MNIEQQRALARAKARARANEQPTTEETLQPEAEQVDTWGDALGQAAENFPSSAKQFGSDIAQTVLHPIDTGKALYELGSGIIQLAIPGEQANEKSARAVGEFFAKRYGGENWEERLESIKQTIAKDPVGVVADFSTLLSGGGAAIARAPGIAGKAVNAMGIKGGGRLGRATDMAGGATRTFGGALQKAGDYIDPLTATAKGAGKVAKKTGETFASVVGGLGTGTGKQPIIKAYQAGREGGERSKALTDTMRGNDDLSDLPDKMREGVDRMKLEKQQKLSDENQKWARDPTELDFTPVISEWFKIREIMEHKGLQKIGKEEKAIIDNLEGVLNEWMVANPADALTPAGLDALKQRLGNVKVPNDPNYDRALMARTGIYNAVKDQIIQQVPDYARAMDDYAKASKLEQQINKSFSLTPNAMDETIMKKGMAAMRNNADTNYGKRLELAEKLEQYQPNITSRLSGELLNPEVPVGLVGRSGALANLATPGPSWALLPFQSPRGMGEIAHGAGVVDRLGRKVLKGIGANPKRGRLAGRLGYQSGRAKGILEDR